MDRKDQGQRWFMNHRRSPSPFSSRQPTHPTARVLDKRSLVHGTIERQQSWTPYPWDSDGQYVPSDTPHGQPSGTSSQTLRTKRRRRSSSFCQGEHRQGFVGEARARDRHRPPERRRRVVDESENDQTTRASSVPPGRLITRQTSGSLSPQGYHTPQAGPAPSIQSSWSPTDPFLHRNREDRSTNASPRVRQADGIGSRDGYGRSPPEPFNRDASRGGEVSHHRLFQEPAMENRSNNSQLSRGQERLPVHAYGATYNITNTGNMFMGTNYGNAHMQLKTARLEELEKEFMLHLADLLKICVRADHMYYAPGEEEALRRGQCTPGTRIEIIQSVIRWAMNMSPSSERVYWLSGHAGAGKTTIAYTIAHHFHTLVSDGNSNAILGGSFFCSRQFLDTRSASSIVRTIVYRLALRSQAFRNALKAHGRFETVNDGPKSQFMGLLITPWKFSAEERLDMNEPCYVISIDALDELEGAGAVEFLGTLFDVVDEEDLAGLKFFITSRSEPALVRKIASFPNKQVCRLEEVPLEESSADIEVYLLKNLAPCANPWQIQQLVSDAAGLFIYAATVVEFLKGRDLEEQRGLLNRLLSTSSSIRRPSRAATAKLDNLYLQILETCLVDPRERNDPEVFQDCLSILQTFLCTIERTSTSVAVDILNASGVNGGIVLDIGTANGVLHRLHAVLYSQGGRVMSFHKSFSDFLFDEGRSQRFFCNQEHHHHRLANGCFQMMAKQLRFNIASIPSSYQMDCDLPTLPHSIETNIPVSLRYACANWSAHLVLKPFGVLDDLVETVQDFLQLRILFWMESMNLLGQQRRCESMLSESQQWVLKSKNEVQIISQLSDAAAFADYHCKSEAVQSTPHLYLSSLATFSRSTSSVIVQHWRRQVGGIPGFINAYASGEKALGSSITFSNEVTALTVSQDGANVAVVTGHTDCVRTVAYSLDGTHIVSGSGDTSIRVWSVSGGEQVRVLRGHTHWVLAIASSPDGTNVVSGSWDTSVRVWDLTTGEEVMVLKGHTDWVLAVAYSPGGAYAVSGSADRTLRVWDLTKGDSEEVRVLNGHTDVVNAVAYSPDGTRVVSGSHDRSVRIWDLSMGEEAMILKGHSDSVTAVAYSPDGTRVVSGSRDKSVRVWDVSTGAFLVLKGHSRWVQTVACSPDGVYVVSGSHDESVRVWHLSTGGVVKVFMGHIGRVNSVGYSFDGAHVVSGSDDRSIRVWDALPAHTPRYVRQQGPRGGYTGWLLSPSDPSAYLMFVHPEAFLPDDANVLTFPASAVPQLDFSNAKFGERWVDCYTPWPF